jgi:4-hydroxy-3-polyprenylbenzoate decarboxylase
VFGRSLAADFAPDSLRSFLKCKERKMRFLPWEYFFLDQNNNNRYFLRYFLKEGEMAFRDLREFIQALEETEDSMTIAEEVDWDLEAGAVNRRAYEMSGPALLFNHIKDYPPGHSIYAGSMGTFRRAAIALGLPPTAPVKDIYAAYEEGLKNPVEPVIVGSGKCKENIFLGDDVDLYCLPAPMVHEGDGGRYIGTWDCVVAKDPDSEWMNWGMYRFMINDQKSIVGFPLPTSHFGTMLRTKFVPENKPMPMALVIGCEPLIHMAAFSTYKWGASEAHLAGGLRKEPVELVKCETSDLLVPANAEIVIEGEVQPDVTMPEGPFGEYPGYRTGKVTGGAFCKVKAITHRSSPILTMISLGMPPDDNAIGVSITSSLTMKERLERHGIPVTHVFVPPAGVIHFAVVQVKKGGRRMAKQVLDVLTERRVFASKILVVDTDIDPFNMDEVIHAFSTKCHPIRGIMVNEYLGRGNPITPYYTHEERERLDGATIVFDCTWPLEWAKESDIPVKASFSEIYSEETQKKVLGKWPRYGFK